MILWSFKNWELSDRPCDWVAWLGVLAAWAIVAVTYLYVRYTRKLMIAATQQLKEVASQTQEIARQAAAADIQARAAVELLERERRRDQDRRRQFWLPIITTVDRSLAAARAWLVKADGGEALRWYVNNREEQVPEINRAHLTDAVTAVFREDPHLHQVLTDADTYLRRMGTTAEEVRRAQNYQPSFDAAISNCRLLAESLQSAKALLDRLDIPVAG